MNELLEINDSKIDEFFKKYGYVRVSSKDQNEDRQMIEMENKKLENENIGGAL